MKLNFLSLLLMLGFFNLSAQNSVMDIIANSNKHNTLEAAINAAGLNETLSGPGPFTVFAPTDKAFNDLPPGTVEALLNDIPTLTNILLYHVAGDSIVAGDLSNNLSIPVLNNSSLLTTITVNGAVYVNNARITVTNLIADNGVVHIINCVMIPTTTNTVMDYIVQSKKLSTLEAALTVAGLDDVLRGDGPFTVFAPTNKAFNALPPGTVDALLADIPRLTDILLYHGVDGELPSANLTDSLMITAANGDSILVTVVNGRIFINQARVSVADVVLDNGIIHVITEVILPPTPFTVMDIIENSPNHNTLEAAINAADLDGALNAPGTLTVFAPTDDAFAALPAGTVEALLGDIPALTNILLYHVAGLTALSGDLTDGQLVMTLNGSDVTVTINADGVFINDAQVTVADLVADNGVVHVINAVLLPPAPVTTVMDIITNSADHNILEAAINAAGLNEALSGDGPFTVFAPTDAAFAALPAGTVEALLGDIPALTNILLYHVAGITALSGDLTDGQMVTTLNGSDVTVTINGDGVFINDAQVIVADLVADNGVVHVIDAVLLPPPPVTTVMDIIANSADHNTLEAAIVAAGLDGTLSGPGTFTVFAPTDAAFAALPAGTVEALLGDIPALTNILLYHVAGVTALSGDITDGQLVTTLNGSDVTVTINGDGVFINDAQVIVADLVADNGVVHVINAVLLPPPAVTTVMDIIENSADHNVLEAAINAAGLNGTLSGPGTFTVFAPTDDAFAALPPGTVAALLGDIPALTNILLYHVAGVTALSGDLTDGQMVMTLNGSDVTVTINGDGVFINDAQVIVADLVADNGVVHVIDAVLLPPPPVTTVMDIIANSADHNTLEAAIVAAGLDGTLSGPGTFTVFAPTDAAFAALPAGTVEALLGDIPALTNILLYHVAGVTALSGDLTDGQLVTTLNGSDVTVTINGDGVFINDAQVIVADLVADNGVVHVIDAVLLPPPAVITVMDIIENSADHNVLEAAINAAGLDGALSGDGPFTVFAPTDDAFAALPPGTVAALLGDIPALTNILLYHVAGVTALSGDLTDGQLVTTLNGSDVTVTINGDGVFINDAQVIVADLVADNGVVHVIDAVLLPPPPAANFGSDNAGVAVNSTISEISGLYPVPATERLFVSNTEAIEYIFQVTDFSGRVLKTGTLNGDNSIEVSDLLPGVYTLILRNENTISSGKFIKN